MIVFFPNWTQLLNCEGALFFKRDVFLQKTCDEGCLQLAQMLGWEVSSSPGQVSATTREMKSVGSKNYVTMVESSIVCVTGND